MLAYWSKIKLRKVKVNYFSEQVLILVIDLKWVEI